MATAKKTPAKKTPAKKAPVKRAAPTKAVAEKAPIQGGVDWKSLYLYAVCLVTLLVVLFSTVALVRGIMDAVFPDPVYIDPYAKDENMPDPALLQQQADNNARSAIKNIFTTFSTILIAAPVYLYHWRQARKISN